MIALSGLSLLQLFTGSQARLLPVDNEELWAADMIEVPMEVPMEVTNRAGKLRCRASIPYSLNAMGVIYST